MTTRTRSAQAPAPASPVVPVRRHKALAVTGSVPAALDGSLLQAAAHPGCTSADQAPLLNYGVRLSGGTARWYRQDTAPQEQPADSRPARVWTGGRGPDEVGSTAVARPAGDPVVPLWHTVATYPGLGYAEHLRLGPDGEVRQAEPFALDGAPLMHAVAATGRYAVVFDLPVTHRRAAALVGARFPYAWQEGRPARLGLLGRGSEPRWFPIRPCYVFNAVNAYDDGDRVVVDAIRHERAFDAAARPAPPELWRWTLDLRDGSVTERRLAAASYDRPEVDPRVRGRRHRYVYGTGPADAAGGDPTGTALVRHDLVTGTVQVRPVGPGCIAGQPVFVPRPPSGRRGSVEGDGWLVTVVDDPARARSDILILDARDLCGPPVATVHLPVRLPAGIHTHWQPGG
jgi:carotenoid cleavage dioxygenase-like enzyme